MQEVIYVRGLPAIVPCAECGRSGNQFHSECGWAIICHTCRKVSLAMNDQATSIYLWNAAQGDPYAERICELFITYEHKTDEDNKVLLDIGV